jgi:transcriptional regulator with XRE-family HTH domain
MKRSSNHPRRPRTPSVAQFRAARALIGWSQDRLAEEAEVGRATVGDFERGARQPIRLTMKALQQALEAAGIAFLWTEGGGEGVMLAPAETPTQPAKDAASRE